MASYANDIDLESIRSLLVERLGEKTASTIDVKKIAVEAAIRREETQPYDRLPAEREFTVEDLLVWRDSRRGHHFGVNPGSKHPVLVMPKGDIVAVFARGEIRGVRGSSGSRIWTYSGRRYASGWTVSGSRIFVTYTHRVVCLDDRGNPVWEHTPYPESGEWIYSRPVVAGDRLFYGDRAGYFNCLDVSSGRLLWDAYTSRARNNDVNADAAIVDDRVIVATNSRKVICFEQVSGAKVWETRIDRPCSTRVLYRNGSLWFTTFSSLYEISPEDGEIKNRLRFPGHDIPSFEVTPDTLLVVARPSKGPINPTGKPAHLVGFRDGKEVFRIPYVRYVSPHLTYDCSTGYVYESENIGIGVIDPLAGKRVASIRGFHAERYGHFNNRTTPPVVRGDAMYLATDRGAIMALRTPWRRGGQALIS